MAAKLDARFMSSKRTPKDPASGKARPAEGMGGLAKGLAIIEALATSGVQSAADAARASHSTRAAARRCLLTLTELGYVERIGREFRPLPRLRGLGRGRNLQELLVEESTPLLAAACRELNESVSLAVLDGESALFLARAEAEHIISTGVRVGARLPVYCSATGRILLSRHKADELRAMFNGRTFPRRTAKTLTGPALIIREIEAAAKAGFAATDEELEFGMRSLAVPVLSPDGDIVAALSVSAYSARVSRDILVERFRLQLEDTASELEARLYGQGRRTITRRQGSASTGRGTAATKNRIGA